MRTTAPRARSSEHGAAKGELDRGHPDELALVIELGKYVEELNALKHEQRTVRQGMCRALVFQMFCFEDEVLEHEFVPQEMFTSSSQPRMEA